MWAKRERGERQEPVSKTEEGAGTSPGQSLVYQAPRWGCEVVSEGAQSLWSIATLWGLGTLLHVHQQKLILEEERQKATHKEKAVIGTRCDTANEVAGK